MAENTEKTDASFEELLDKLEGIVGRLEEGDLGLEQSLKAYEEGVALVRGAQGRLDSMEARLQQLTEGGQIVPLEDWGLILEELSELRDRVEAELSALSVEGLIEPPERLVSAARHALLAGGKRLRPLLALCWAEALGGSAEDAMPGALAVELIHTYSLVHDDLPALDDDDLRRGKPTVHKAYDEATAILAGDALLTDAFYVLAGAPRNAAAQCRELARAAGSAGMVGGQMRDMLGEGSPSGTATKPEASSRVAPSLTLAVDEVAEGSPSGTATKPEASSRVAPSLTLAVDEVAEGSPSGTATKPEASSRVAPSLTLAVDEVAELLAIHMGKTAALFVAACALGAWSVTDDEAVVEDARAYAVKLGLAFQIADDVLDVVGDEAARGKKAGKDEERGKLTFVRAYGLERAREMALEEAEAAAEIGGRYGERLVALARFAASRSS